ncbi:ribosome biogenesis protein LTV1 [Ascoidea rubescens DSM 1968]|uniref:Low temperature viability protein n=1 Tax=Ascoidea rubescens DSM 1968 TaxID=1344418 RepID=A0A1D2VIF2_9ASCO|nr:Low temperature viability protein [Ascoidea rubescens DSM 1968]ODV61247.1 Low temperature viability protein [Ascoidea rubescens DSM 1968]
MSTRKWVDKKTAKTFAVVHRSHEDPEYFNDEAPPNVLVEVKKYSTKSIPRSKIKTQKDLEGELKHDIESGKIRSNEGQAALFGITYDDSKYDYMQHLKPIGGTSDNLNNKKKTSLTFKEDLQLPKELFASEKTVKLSYQAFQNVPDDIKGFKPDMNPDLREVLEALTDEEFIDEKDDDLFNDLLKSGQKDNSEDDYNDYDDYDYDDYDDLNYDDYDSDRFKKKDDQGWEADFRKYKQFEDKKPKNNWDSDDDFNSEDDELGETDFNSTAMKRKKGAMTDTSTFSMSSSALFRTDGLTLLDERFEKVSRDYEEEDEDDYKPFDMSKQTPGFEDMLVDFLDNYEIEGKKLVKKDDDIEKYRNAAKLVSRSQKKKNNRLKTFEY